MRVWALFGEKEPLPSPDAPFQNKETLFSLQEELEVRTSSFIKLESPGSTDMLISTSYPLQDKSNSFKIVWVRNKQHEVAEDASLCFKQKHSVTSLICRHKYVGKTCYFHNWFDFFFLILSLFYIQKWSM